MGGKHGLFRTKLIIGFYFPEMRRVRKVQGKIKSDRITKRTLRILLRINPLEEKAELPQLMQFGRVKFWGKGRLPAN